MTFSLFAFSGGLIAISSGVMAAVMLLFAKNWLHRLWALFCISVLVWGAGGLIIGLTQDPAQAELWWRITHIGIAFIPTLFLDFVYSFLERKRGKKLVAFYAISTAFSILALFSNLLVAHTRLVFGQFYYDSPPGILYPLFTAYFFGVIIYSHAILYNAYRVARTRFSESDIIQRTRIRYFFLATLVGFSGGSLSFLPVYGIDIYPVANFMVVLYPIIMGYAILRHKLFDIRVAVAQGLVFLLWLFVGVRFMLSTSANELASNGALFVAVTVLGLFLVRNIEKEIESREQAQRLAEELKKTNERQEGLLHFIGHEVKGFLTKDIGTFAALIEGDFGQLPQELRPLVERALAQSRDGANSVADILKASNQKKGTITYQKEPFDFRALATEVVEREKPIAEHRGLALSCTADESQSYQMTGDKGELGDHVLRNVIENAINYTPSGSIEVSLAKKDGRIVFAVKDTGVGITEEDKARLFTEGGHGKESQKINVYSTGYGLYISKNIVEAHGGTIRAESEGQGKGSTFIIELPA